MELIVEQVSRAKKLLKQHHIVKDTITIGRAYDNDIILTDPYVCAHHLVLKADELGIWRAYDQDSVNGSVDEQGRALAESHRIHSGEIIALGKSQLRLILPYHPVAATIRFSGIEGILNTLSSPLILSLVMLLYMGLLLSQQYLLTHTEVKAAVLFRSLATVLMVSSAWPLLCALLARLFKNEARILTQLVLSYSFFIGFLLVAWVGDIISFNSSHVWLSTLFDYVSQGVLVFALLWTSFYVAFHQHSWRRTAMASFFTLAMTAISLIYDTARLPDFNPVPHYNGILLAPEFVLTTPVSIHEFISSSERIFDDAAAAVKETDETRK